MGAVCFGGRTRRAGGVGWVGLAEAGLSWAFLNTGAGLAGSSGWVSGLGGSPGKKGI